MNTKKFKHTLSSILFASTSLLYFLLAYIGYGKQNLDLSEYSQYQNTIINKGIGIHYESKGRKSQVFYIALNNLDEKLGIYRMSKNYDDLLDKIKIGDSIKVYYRPNSNEKENINIDLVQVEKNGKILISKNEYENKESALIYIGLIAGIGTLFLAFRHYKYGYIF
ncbi:hypothetical protein SAMN05660477_00452 [Soonwooa buanensis]|uniref:DUF3592 domain-containing protein n=1 Tax=Soonwooa buanensis TaxID=619805 RepID=A0A1T5CY23_9FLAO|nr:hypothetical protein [Soonwooa buanensis]SKB64362.1 hypothetical protein SAMN05660477_00452 [Soonwooa buanensis]